MVNSFKNPPFIQSDPNILYQTILFFGMSVSQIISSEVHTSQKSTPPVKYGVKLLGSAHWFDNLGQGMTCQFHCPCPRRPYDLPCGLPFAWGR